MTTPDNTTSAREDTHISARDSEYQALSAHYRSVAVETTPDALNRTVLEHAAQATHKNSTNFWRLSWLRPLAFAATIGLSLALVLQIGVVDFPDGALNQAGHSNAQSEGSIATDSFDAAAEIAIEQFRAAENTAQQSLGDSETAAAESSDRSASFAPLAPQGIDQDNAIPSTELHCTTAQRTTTAGWWRCIEALESRGQTDAATREIKALFAAYPAYGVAE